MVRNTLSIPMPSAGLNTEISDLTDAPNYSKDELNMDILADGSRARRLGLEYESGYKFSNSSVEDPNTGTNYQSTEIKSACNAFEWVNYDNKGNSIIVIQMGRYIHLFNGINNGHALSDDESETYTIDLYDYAVDNTSDNYKNTFVKFTSGYGKLFISSPYIEVIMLDYNQSYKYTQSTSAKVELTIAFNSTNRNRFTWRKNTAFIIKDKQGTEVFNYAPWPNSYYEVGGNQTVGVPYLVNLIQDRLINSGLLFTVTSNGNNTITLTSPSGTQYNGYTAIWKADYVSRKTSNFRDHYGDKSSRSADGKYPTTTGVLSGAKESGVTIPEGLKQISITPKVRDTQGLQRMYTAGGSLVEEGANDYSPTTLTDLHKYNLLNQGWDEAKITAFNTANGYYPSNALSWYVLKDANGQYAPATVVNHAFGSSLAPRGKLILNAYEMDRDRASNINSIPDSAFAKDRPEDITFYAGRLWYALGSRLLYSQIITEDASLVDKCYQSADPTSEDVSDPVDTDGGVINVHQCGKVLAVRPLGSSLIAFGNKGIMAIIPGNNIGFTPTSYYQSLVSNVGIFSKSSIVSVGNAIYYWSPLGIFMVAFNENGQLVSQNISFETIHSFYKGLSEFSIENCVARFNSVKNEINFMYPTLENSPKCLNAILKYNIVTNAWTPMEIPLTSFESPFIVNAVELKNAIDTKPKAIVESNGDPVLANGEEIVITHTEPNRISYDTLSYLVINGENLRLTFANFTNIAYKDWTIGDILGDGYNFKSYLVTHPIMFNSIYSNKQAPYVSTTFLRSERGELFKSGCFMSTRWDWASNPYSFKWDINQQVYRLPADSSSRYYKFNESPEFVTTKTRVRGSGKSLQLRFENDGNKYFRLCAVGIDARGYNK